MIDQEAVDWKIETIRNAIASDWAELGTKGLTYEQRKVIHVRLQTRLKTLSQLKQHMRSPSDPTVRTVGMDAVRNALGL